jgi:hypothetical protein
MPRLGPRGWRSGPKPPALVPHRGDLPGAPVLGCYGVGAILRHAATGSDITPKRMRGTDREGSWSRGGERPHPDSTRAIAIRPSLLRKTTDRRGYRSARACWTGKNWSEAGSPGPRAEAECGGELGRKAESTRVSEFLDFGPSRDLVLFFLFFCFSFPFYI